MEPAGIEPATSGLQSLAQGGPFTEKISIYTGFVRISEAPHSTDTDQIRISTYPVTYPPTVHSMKLPTPGVAREPNADRDCSNRLLDRNDTTLLADPSGALLSIDGRA